MPMTMTELQFDGARAVQEIGDALRHQVGKVLGRSGIVVAMSGGVDSAVCAALAAGAVGPQRVLGLGLPERESDAQSLVLASDWATQLGIEFLAEDITPVLDACGCYTRRDAAVRQLERLEAGRGAREERQRNNESLGFAHHRRFTHVILPPPTRAKFRPSPLEPSTPVPT